MVVIGTPSSRDKLQSGVIEDVPRGRTTLVWCVNEVDVYWFYPSSSALR